MELSMRNFKDDPSPRLGTWHPLLLDLQQGCSPCHFQICNRISCYAMQPKIPSRLDPEPLCC